MYNLEKKKHVYGSGQDLEKDWECYNKSSSSLTYI